MNTVLFSEIFSDMCPEGYGYVKEVPNGETMEGIQHLDVLNGLCS